MLLIVLKSSIAALIFAIGMTATVDDIIYLWKRPMLLLKSLLAMYVVMPAVAVLIARTLDLPPKTGLAVVVLAICAGAPLLPKKLIKFGGDPAYVFSLIVATSLLAIATVPASLHILSGIVSFDTNAVTPSQVAGVILKTFLMPLGLGMLFRLAAPKLAERIRDPLLKIAGTVMALGALAALAIGFRLVFEVGLPSLLAFAAFTLAAIVVGHFLAGPSPLIAPRWRLPVHQGISVWLCSLRLTRAVSIRWHWWWPTFWPRRWSRFLIAFAYDCRTKGKLRFGFTGLSRGE